MQKPDVGLRSVRRDQGHAVLRELDTRPGEGYGELTQELSADDLAWAASVARAYAARVPSHFAVDELIQLAQIQVWMERKKYKPEEHPGVPFRAYAWQAVRGACRMAVRRRRWNEAFSPSVEDVDEPEALAAKCPDELFEQRKAVARVDDAVNALPAKMRKLIELRYSDGLTVREAALKLGITETRATSLHATAIQRLRGKLAQ